MNGSQKKQIVRLSPRRRTGGLTVGIAAAVTVGFAASVAAMAHVAGGIVSVTSASSSPLGEQITVDAQGRTLYALSPETTHHLLCKSSQCLKSWPPLTVRSSKTKLKTGPGVRGHLAILRRKNGVLQVTLGGLPLYHYSGDHTPGEASGQSIQSFGGTWHVLAATSNVTPTAPTAPTTPTPKPGYRY